MRLGLLLILFSTTSQLRAQTDFVKINFTPDTQEMTNFIRTKSNHFVLSGNFAKPITTYPYFTQYAHIIKTDSIGNVIWNKKFGPPSFRARIVYITNILEAPDGYVVTTNVAETNYPSIFKTDVDGNLIWYKTIYLSNRSAPGFGIFNTRNCLDGGFILVANWFTKSPDTYNVYIIKMDGDGNVQWDYESGPKREIAFNVMPTPDGSYIVVGTTSEHSVLPSRQHLLLYKISAQGQLVWRKEWGGEEQNVPAQIVATRDGNFAIAFNDSYFNSFGMMKINGDGEILWAKRILASFKGVVVDMMELRSGDLMVMGDAVVPQNTPDFLLTWLVSPEGNLKNLVRHLISDKYPNQPFSMTSGSDGTPVIQGVVYTPTTFADFYITKVGADGCYMPDVDLGKDVETCGEPVNLSIKGTYPSYSWSTTETTSSLIVKTSGVYKLTVSDLNGCSRSDSVKVEVKDCIVRDTCSNTVYAKEDILIPNVITPNGDGKNEFFEIQEPFIGSALTIYNRWGDSVYHAEEYQNDWNGGQVSSGNYFYYISNSCLSSAIKGNLAVVR